MWRNSRTHLIRLGCSLMWFALVGTIVGQGQSLPTPPSPNVGLSVNGKPVPQTIQGEALIVSVVLFHPNIFGKDVTPLVINAQNGSWGNTVHIVVTDSTGATLAWPIHPVSSPPGALTLDGEQTGLLYWILSAADAQNIAPGTYQLLAILDTTASAGSTGWNGTTSSDVVSLQITAPSQPTPAQIQQQMTSQALADHFSGNDTQALADLDQLLTQFPTSIEAIAFKGSLLAGVGRSKEALQAYEQALAGLDAQVGLDPEEPPAELLRPIAALRRVVYGGPGGGGGSSSTTIVASAPGVTFSMSDQFVTLSAQVSSSAGTVNGGTIGLAVAGLGSPVTSGPVAQGLATVGFLVPGGTHAGMYALTATYSGTDSFGSSTDSTETLNISKATPTITWTSPAPITDGAALSSTQLNATANVPGTFAYNPPAGIVLPVGSGETLRVTFTPSDATDYNSASANVSINVIPAALTITANSATRQYGQANPPLNNVTYSGFVNGDMPGSLNGTLFCTTSATPMTSVGSYAITCSGLTSPNYSITFAPGTLTINPAPLAVAANNNSRPYGANNPVLAGMITGLQNADPIAANFTTTALPTSPVGAYAITPVVLDPSSRLGNYTLSVVNGTLSVVPENTTLSLAISPSSISVGQSATITATLAAPDMVIPIDPSVLGLITMTSPIVSDILSNNGVCFPASGATPGIASCTVTVTSIEPNGRTLNAAFAGTTNLAASAGKADLTVTAPLQSQQVCIRSDFRNVPVAGGNTIWFNSVFKVHEASKQLVHISFFQAAVQFQYTDASGSLVSVNQTLPDARITIDPNTTVASTSFEAINNVWMTTIPWDLDDNSFLTGMPWFVPSAGLPADIEPVTVCGTFASDVANVDIGWRWAAAAYSSLSTDNAALGVKPMDTDHDNQATNHDHAGTPENFKQFVISGARGKGGKNYTGSYSRDAIIE